MVRCNLSILLAEQNLKITKVSNDTGISRTTLTSLANNYGHGIQFDTINKLCMYLKVGPEQLISFAPVDIEIIDIPLDIKSINKREGFDSTIKINIFEKNKKYECHILGHINIDTSYNETFEFYEVYGINIDISLFNANDEEYNEKEHIVLVNAFKQLSRPFISEIEKNIFSELTSKLKEYKNPNIQNDKFFKDSDLYVVSGTADFSCNLSEEILQLSL